MPELGADLRADPGSDIGADPSAGRGELSLAAAAASLRQLARWSAGEQLRELAETDEVTGLANRPHLLQLLDAWLQRPAAAVAVDAASPAGATARVLGLALLAVDVPRITELSLTLGAGAGDALATSIAARLRDLGGGPKALAIAHLGSGQFVLALPLLDLPGPAAAAGLAAASVAQPGGAEALSVAARERAVAVAQALQRPVRLGPVHVLPQCRIGVALHPNDGGQAHGLLAAAQTAQLALPASGGVRLFEPGFHVRALQALRLEAALRDALPRRELSLVYQPQVDLVSGEVIGAEALLRWQSAAYGRVAPEEFIPLAERSGLIAEIGDWVIREACAQSVRWRQAGLPALKVSVNVSPVQFQFGDVALVVRRALADSGALPASLGIELTESALQHDADQVAATLRGLRAEGIEIALDDFGTGFSSLSRLRELPIDLLKIDRSFVSDVTAAPQSASMTRSIINLAHGLQIKVLAEGVETEGQLAMLAANGCDRIQGFLFSPPVSADALAALLHSGRRLSGQQASRSTRRRTLLLVDDEPQILAALRRLFRPDGYQVLCADGGAQALELLATHAVDVIVSDQRMPVMTGVEFLRRTKVLHPNTIRITLSGYTDLQSIIDAVNEGAVYKFLTKPWDDELLRGHVADAFAQKELADDNRRLQGEVAALRAQSAQSAQ